MRDEPTRQAAGCRPARCRTDIVGPAKHFFVPGRRPAARVSYRWPRSAASRATANVSASMTSRVISMRLLSLHPFPGKGGSRRGSSLECPIRRRSGGAP
jgi:hypothetical protein